MPAIQTQVRLALMQSVYCWFTWILIFFNVRSYIGVYFKIFGKGPKEFSDSSVPVQQYLKFETASKSFKQLHVKTMSSSVDAIIFDIVALKLRV